MNGCIFEHYLGIVPNVVITIYTTQAHNGSFNSIIFKVNIIFMQSSSIKIIGYYPSTTNDNLGNSFLLFIPNLCFDHRSTGTNIKQCTTIAITVSNLANYVMGSNISSINNRAYTIINNLHTISTNFHAVISINLSKISTSSINTTNTTNCLCILVNNRFAIDVQYVSSVVIFSNDNINISFSSYVSPVNCKASNTCTTYTKHISLINNIS